VLSPVCCCLHTHTILYWYAIGPKVRRSKPVLGDGFVRAIKTLRTPSCGRNVNPKSPCRKISRHVKCHLRVWINVLCKSKFSFLSPISLAWNLEGLKAWRLEGLKTGRLQQEIKRSGGGRLGRPWPENGPKRHRRKWWYQMTLLLGLPESSVGWIRRFPLSTSSFHHGSSCTYVTREMNNSPVGGPQFRDVAPPHRYDYHRYTGIYHALSITILWRIYLTEGVTTTWIGSACVQFSSIHLFKFLTRTTQG
jgi:hypothetical protein